MHMADALLSPVVGGGFWIASGALIGYSVKKITEEGDNSKTALMGVLGAFVFAVQMINFTIPGTGSSGHLGGGLLLAALLGPHRAFITLVSVLVMQSLFFADGGVLALGCNIFNLAFLPAYIAYPFLYRPLAGNATSGGRMAAASITAATAGMVMGSFFVVAETALSAITELPFTLFLLFMLPIHLAIGIVEGLVTWGVLAFIARTEPGLLVVATKKRPALALLPHSLPLRHCLLAVAAHGLPHLNQTDLSGLWPRSQAAQRSALLTIRCMRCLPPCSKKPPFFLTMGLSLRVSSLQQFAPRLMSAVRFRPLSARFFSLLPQELPGWLWAEKGRCENLDDDEEILPH